MKRKTNEDDEMVRKELQTEERIEERKKKQATRTGGKDQKIKFKRNKT